jgi:hypothetical protein
MKTFKHLRILKELKEEYYSNLRSIVFRFVKNPRQENGDLGFQFCEKCGSHTGAYVSILHETPDLQHACRIKLCKSCLLDAVAGIDKEILK